MNILSIYIHNLFCQRICASLCVEISKKMRQKAEYKKTMLLILKIHEKILPDLIQMFKLRFKNKKNI